MRKYITHKQAHATVSKESPRPGAMACSMVPGCMTSACVSPRSCARGMRCMSIQTVRWGTQGHDHLDIVVVYVVDQPLPLALGVVRAANSKI
jgi:hypothetical protein